MAAAAETPFAAGHRPEDVTLLAKHSFLAGLGIHDLSAFLELLDQIALPPGTAVFRQGDAGDHMYFVLEGALRTRRGTRAVAHLGPGDHFGEVAILGPHTRTTTVETETSTRLARLGRKSFLALGGRRPATALHFVERLAASVAATLTAVSDDVGLLARQRTLPRRSSVRVQIDGRRIEVGTGTLAGSLLPRSVDGGLVVAATLDRRAVSLDTPIAADCTIAPLTTATSEGRLVFRRSCLLGVLEAARRIVPNNVLHAGPRAGRNQLVLAEHPLDPDGVAAIERELAGLAGAPDAEPAIALREELWAIEEARGRFLEQGWTCAASLLAAYRAQTVALLSFGGTFAHAMGPVWADRAALAGVRLEPAPAGFVVHFGPALDAGRTLSAATSVLPAGVPVLPPKTLPAMTREADAWLRAMSVSSVGTFNEACVAGQIGELVRVSEGFHERNIVRVAEEIARRRVRVVTIAGPSSSGKTTFIRRLKVQLEVSGIVPVHLSLDDYYVDRERTPRGDDGELDFESVAALDRALLARHVDDLFAGKAVTLARFDFVSGKSLPDGGERMVLGPSNVLLVEGLHGSNPSVLAGTAASSSSYRVFVHPANALPLDRLSPVLPEDVRLLRRIVRDRRRRGYSARSTIGRWPSVRRGEEGHVLPYATTADFVFDTSLVYEVAVLRVFAERYLLEVPSEAPEFVVAHRLRQLVDRFVPIDSDHVPPTSILREFIGGGFEDV